MRYSSGIKRKSNVILQRLKYSRCNGFIIDLRKSMYNSNKTAYIMIGIQGSGKSTFCRKFLPDVQRINLDTLHTRNKESIMIKECQNKGCDYAVDNTNPTREDRARYIPDAKEKGYRVVGYFMESRLQECIRRNELREGKEVVPATAIAMTSNRLEMPSKEEGFDELYFVANDGEKMTVSEWREDDEL